MPQNKETSVGIKLVADLRNYQKNLSTAQKETRAFKSNVKNSVGDVKNSFAQLMRGDIRALPGFFKAATTSAGGLSKGLQGVKAALISTGIGALFVALGAAIAAVTQYFKGTEEGQIVFKKVMNNIKAYTEPVLQMFGKFGKAIVQLFKGDFSGAWETAKSAVQDVGGAIAQNRETVKELNDIEGNYFQNKRKWNREIKEAQREISELVLKTRDANVSNVEKQQALVKAQQLQETINDRRLKMAQQELKIEEMKASMGDNTIEDNEKIEQLKDSIYETEKLGNDQMRELVNRQNELRPKLVAELALREAILQRQKDANETKNITTIETRKFNGQISTGTTDTGTLADMGTFLDANAEKTKRFKEQLLELNDTQQAVVGSVTGGFEAMAGSLINSLGLAANGFEGFLKGMIQTVTKLIAIALSQSLANAIAGATQSGAATGPAAIFTTPAFIATAVGGVLAAFAAIPKFATGGIVPGSNFIGDNVIARVNSGEEILNSSDPRHRKNFYKNGAAATPAMLPADVQLMDDHILISYMRAYKRLYNRT